MTGAGRQRDARLEREVLALVLGFELAVDPDAGAVVDGLEADRVEPVDRHVDVRAVPADAAAERALALLAVDLRRVGHERRLDELAAAVLTGRVALVVAEVLRVLLEAPQPAELLTVAGPGVDRRRAAVRRQDDSVGLNVGRGRRRRHEPGHGHEHGRTEDTEHPRNLAPFHSSLFCVISRFQRRGHARLPEVPARWTIAA